MASNPQGSNWPGDRRDPSYHDVASANESFDTALLDDFKRTLLSSPDAADAEKVLHVDIKDVLPPRTRNFTYPLTLLSLFPRLPNDDRIDHLCRLFFNNRVGHVFFDKFPNSLLTRQPMLPPLRLSMACLASLSNQGNNDEAENISLAGISLWTSMVEVDNGLVRSIEMLLADVLLIPYGVLSTSTTIRRRTEFILSAALTISRRMHLHNPNEVEPTHRKRLASFSSLMYLLWLWDILHALVSNLAMKISSSEIFTQIPSSHMSFQHVYRSLIHAQGDKGSQSYFCGLRSVCQEDAVCLLFGILTDSIMLRRSLSSPSNVIRAAPLSTYQHDPYATLFAHSELDRMQAQLSVALNRWYEKYGLSMAPDVLALYHYCRLYLDCSDMPVLTELAQRQQPFSTPVQADVLSGSSAGINISDRSLNHAWALLDSAATRPKSTGTLCAAWMPVAVFHASLVVWAKIRLSAGHGGETLGSIRSLLAFKMELEAMPWPICAAMAATLQQLISN